MDVQHRMDEALHQEPNTSAPSLKVAATVVPQHDAEEYDAYPEAPETLHKLEGVTGRGFGSLNANTISREMPKSMDSQSIGSFSTYTSPEIPMSSERAKDLDFGGVSLSTATTLSPAPHPWAQHSNQANSSRSARIRDCADDILLDCLRDANRASSKLRFEVNEIINMWRDEDHYDSRHLHVVYNDANRVFGNLWAQERSTPSIQSKLLTFRSRDIEGREAGRSGLDDGVPHDAEANYQQQDQQGSQPQLPPPPTAPSALPDMPFGSLEDSMPSFGMPLEFSNPDSLDVLDNFDFDSFLKADGDGRGDDASHQGRIQPPPARAAQRSNTTDRHPQSRTLPGPPEPDKQPNYLQESQNDSTQLPSEMEEALTQGDLFQQVEDAVASLGQSSYGAPHRGNYPPSSLGVHREGSIVDAHLSPAPPQDQYSSDSDAEARQGLAMMQAAADDDDRRAHGNGPGRSSGYRRQLNSIEGRIVRPPEETDSDDDFAGVDMSSFGGGYDAHMTYGGDSSVLEDIGDVKDHDTYGQSSLKSEDDHTMDSVHPLPAFNPAARVDVGGTGGLSEPTAESSRNGWDGKDVAGQLSIDDEDQEESSEEAWDTWKTKLTKPSHPRDRRTGVTNFETGPGAPSPISARIAGPTSGRTKKVFDQQLSAVDELLRSWTTLDI